MAYETYYLYRLMDGVDDIRYVGCTIMGLRKRFQAHINDSSRYDYPVSRWLRKHPGEIAIRLHAAHSDIDSMKSAEKREIKRLGDLGFSLLNATAGGDGEPSSFETQRKIAESRFKTVTAQTPFYDNTTDPKVMGIIQNMGRYYFVSLRCNKVTYYGGNYQSVEEAIPHLHFLQDELHLEKSEIPSCYLLKERAVKPLGAQGIGHSNFETAKNKIPFYKGTDMPKIRCISNDGGRAGRYLVAISKSGVTIRGGTFSNIDEAIKALHALQAVHSLPLSAIPDYYCD